MIEKTGPSLGIAFADQLLHGWDLAKSTGQDTTMPNGLPDVAFELIHGRFTEEQRKGVFKPEVALPRTRRPKIACLRTRDATRRWWSGRVERLSRQARPLTETGRALPFETVP